MISACLYQYNNTILNKILRHWLSSLACIAAISSSIILTKGEYTFSIWIGLSLFFICTANGNTLFGILALEPLRFLGLISYSIYLMHGVIFAVIFCLILNGINYQSSILLSAPTIIIVCTLTYIYILKGNFQHLPFQIMLRLKSKKKWAAKRPFYLYFIPSAIKLDKASGTSPSQRLVRTR